MASIEAAPSLPPRLTPKPKITLQIPQAKRNSTGSPFYWGPAPFHNISTPSTGMPHGNAYVNPFHNMYPTKASEFMFKQFEGFKDFTMNTAKSGLSAGEKSAFWLYNKISCLSKRWFTHIFLFLCLLLYSVLGALMFAYFEGWSQPNPPVAIDSVRTNFIMKLGQLVRTHHYNVQDKKWLNETMERLVEYEKELERANKDMAHYRGWNFWNSMFYSGTIYTTIGYGHIVPSTRAGRVATILYAIIGIPLFLIVLADFGKLLTRIMKYLWAFVRRLYYTGSCRKVRGTAPVQEVMKGLNMMYDAVRRPSQIFLDEEGGLDAPDAAVERATRNSLAVPGQGPAEGPNTEHPGTEPQTPAPSVFQIDDEFNLPISVAIVILIGYIICGAIVYSAWEPWTFFEAFYFVFISMSTIGFGDYVPKHPMYMMASILYLVFGLALTSMCINVVQVKLSDTFRQASMKIGATIGLKVADEDGSLVPISPQPIEIAPVHGSGDTTTVAVPSVQRPLAKETETPNKDP